MRALRSACIMRQHDLFYLSVSSTMQSPLPTLPWSSRNSCQNAETYSFPLEGPEKADFLIWRTHSPTGTFQGLRNLRAFLQYIPRRMPMAEIDIAVQVRMWKRAFVISDLDILVEKQPVEMQRPLWGAEVSTESPRLLGQKPTLTGGMLESQKHCAFIQEQLECR